MLAYIPAPWILWDMFPPFFAWQTASEPRRCVRDRRWSRGSRLGRIEGPARPEGPANHGIFIGKKTIYGIWIYDNLIYIYILYIYIYIYIYSIYIYVIHCWISSFPLLDLPDIYIYIHSTSGKSKKNGIWMEYSWTTNGNCHPEWMGWYSPWKMALSCGFYPL